MEKKYESDKAKRLSKGLEGLFEDVVNNSDIGKPELAAAYLEKYKQAAEMTRETTLEEFRVVISSSVNAVKAALLLNGGSCIAILTFLGRAGVADRVVLQTLTKALCFFGGGVLIAACASMSVYFCQLAAQRQGGESKQFRIYKAISTGNLALSLAAFLCGLIIARNGFLLMAG